VARDSLTLGVFVLGVLLGLSLFVRFLSWWLHRHFALTVSVLAGVVLGSLVKIWPWKERLSVTEESKLLLLSSNVWPDWSNPANWLVVILIVLGFVLILVSNRWSVADDFEKKSKA
jgi:putative membrane protein